MDNFQQAAPVGFEEHANVAVPPFLNRRTNAQHLKNSYPAGFHTKVARKHVSGEMPHYAMDDFPRGYPGKKAAPFTKIPNVAYTTWTLGAATQEEFDGNSSVDMSGVNSGDPYAGMAGVYYSQIGDADHAPVVKVNNLDIAPTDSSLGPEPRKSLRKRDSPTKSAANRQTYSLPVSKIYHAPSALPGLNPSLPTTRPINHLIEKSNSVYDHLINKDPVVQQISWQRRGNDRDHNYSAYGFHGDNTYQKAVSSSSSPNSKSLQLQLQQQLSPSQETMMTDTLSNYGISPDFSPLMLRNIRPLSPSPIQVAMTRVNSMILDKRPMPEQLVVEVYTVNQMMAAISPDQITHQHYEKMISFDTSLHSLKNSIVAEIVAGVERACKFDEIGSHSSQSNDDGTGNGNSEPDFIDYDKIELVFFCFIPDSSSWRRLVGEEDWLKARQLFRCGKQNDRVKLMYALDQTSEWMLLRKIEQNFNARKINSAILKTPQISLQSLTDSLERSMELKQHPYYVPLRAGQQQQQQQQQGSKNPSRVGTAASAGAGAGGSRIGTAAGDEPGNMRRSGSLGPISTLRTGTGAGAGRSDNNSSRQRTNRNSYSRVGTGSSGKRLGSSGIVSAESSRIIAGYEGTVGVGEIALTARTDRTDGYRGPDTPLNRSTVGTASGHATADRSVAGTVRTHGTAPSTAMMNLALRASQWSPPAPPGATLQQFATAAVTGMGDSLTQFSETVSDTSSGQNREHAYESGRNYSTVGPVAQRSLLYPKRSAALDRLQEEANAAKPRQEKFANALEKRLFKTTF